MLFEEGQTGFAQVFMETSQAGSNTCRRLFHGMNLLCRRADGSAEGHATLDLLETAEASIYDASISIVESEKLPGHDRWTNCLRFLPEQAALVAGGEDGSLKIFRRQEGARRFQLSSQLSLHNFGVNSLESSKDGSLLFSSSIDGTVRITRMPHGESEGLIKLQGQVKALAFDAKFQNLYAAVHKQGVQVLCLEPRKVVRTLRRLPGEAVALAVLEAANLLAVACDQGQLAFYDLGSGVFRKKVSLSSEVLSMRASPSGRLLAVSNRGEKLSLVSLDTELSISVQSIALRRNASSLCFLSSEVLLLGSSDGCIEVVDLLTAKTRQGPQIFSRGIWDLAQAGSQLFACGDSEWIQAADLHSNLQRPPRLDPASKTIHLSLGLSPLCCLLLPEDLDSSVTALAPITPGAKELFITVSDSGGAQLLRASIDLSTRPDASPNLSEAAAAEDNGDSLSLLNDFESFADTRKLVSDLCRLNEQLDTKGKCLNSSQQRIASRVCSKFKENADNRGLRSARRQAETMAQLIRTEPPALPQLLLPDQALFRGFLGHQGPVGICLASQTFLHPADRKTSGASLTFGRFQAGKLLSTFKRLHPCGAIELFSGGVPRCLVTKGVIYRANGISSEYTGIAFLTFADGSSLEAFIGHLRIVPSPFNARLQLRFKDSLDTRMVSFDPMTGRLIAFGGPSISIDWLTGFLHCSSAV